MYQVYEGTVAKIPKEVTMENCFFMWWDIVAKHSFVVAQTIGRDTVFAPTELKTKETQDAIFETLLKILNLKDVRCQSCALHGLGHLHHPDGARVVQRFINRHRKEATEEDIAWVMQCL